MIGWLTFVAAGLLLSLAGALWRVWRGPAQADRMMAAQLVGTGGVGVVMVLAALGDWAALDVALVLALLAAFAAVAFVKANSADGAGDPEERAPDATLLQPRAGRAGDTDRDTDRDGDAGRTGGGNGAGGAAP